MMKILSFIIVWVNMNLHNIYEGQFSSIFRDLIYAYLSEIIRLLQDTHPKQINEKRSKNICTLEFLY